jgi:fumarate hydratase class II
MAAERRAGDLAAAVGDHLVDVHVELGATAAPVHPNDHVNMAQSSNDSFPSAMCIAAAVNVKERLLPAVTALRDAIASKSKAWSDIVKIGRTHMQDATPLTLGQEWSGYAGMLSDNLERIEGALPRLIQMRREHQTAFKVKGE